MVKTSRIQVALPFCLLLTLCMPALHLAQSADYEVVHYSTDDGLSDTQVTGMVQDSSGFLWIGTRNWLNRFDGYEFAVYNDLPGSKPRLHGSFILQMKYLPGGKIFLKYEKQDAFADLLDPRTETLEQLWLDESNGFKGTYARCLEMQGIQYFLAADEQFTYVHLLGKDLKFKLLLQVPHQPFRNNELNWTSSLVPLDATGSTWLLQTETHGLRLVSRCGEVLRVFSIKDFDYPEGAENLSATSLEKHSNGRVYYRFRFNFQPDTFVEYLPETQRWQQVQPFPTRSMPGNVEAWFYDPDLANVFYITKQSGFQKITPARRYFQTFCDSDLQAWDFGISVRGMGAAGNGKILCTTENAGWFLLDAKTGASEPFVPKEENENPQFLAAAGRNVYFENDSIFWACNSYGTDVNGVLYHVNINSRALRSFQFDRTIERFCRTSDGKIWLATPGGPNSTGTYFARLDPSDGRFTNVVFDNEPPLLKAKFPAYFLESREKGRLWFSNEGGLYLLDTERMTILKGFFDENSRKELGTVRFPAWFTLSNPNVMVIHETPEGMLWIGTNGGGVNILDPETGEVKILTTDNGLPDNRICGILPDGKDWWFSTWRGLACYDPATGTFRNFFDTDGLAHNEFNRLSFCSDPEGRLWFGGMNGVSAFFPAELKQKKKVTRLLLAEVGFFDKDGKTFLRQRAGFGECPHFTLPANNRSAWFKVNLADFANVEGNTFFYRIDQHGTPPPLRGEGGWKLNGPNRLIRFDYLPSGDYVFRVRGQSGNGATVENELQIRLTVQEFFYKTTWFMALCALALGLLAYTFHRIRLAQMLHLERMRTRISSDLHDEVGGLLSGVALQMELLEYSAADEKQKDFIHRIAATSRNAMSKMRDVIWAIDARKDTLDDLLEKMKEFAQESLSPLDIEYRFEVENLPLKGKIASELRHNLYLIFKEFLTNTTKHAGAGHVHIRLSRHAGVFEMRLQDDGKGFQQPVKTTGQGLANIKMRAKRIGATLEFLYGEGFGISLKRKAF